jgi:hypothetical protein
VRLLSDDVPPQAVPFPAARGIWRAVADGEWRLARYGTDYRNVRNFQSAGALWARKHGYRWESRQGENAVAFRITLPGSPGKL